MTSLLCNLLQLYIVVILARVALSWFPTEPGSGLAQVEDVLRRLTDPVLVPVRSMFGASIRTIDFSPIVVTIGLSILISAIC